MDWDRAEAAVGTRLPTDYKEYVYWFGSGAFDDYLIIACLESRTATPSWPRTWTRSAATPVRAPG
ncbi:hypothetical protein GCM10020295_32690 [Streptomyces cinereospinus]